MGCRKVWDSIPEFNRRHRVKPRLIIWSSQFLTDTWTWNIINRTTCSVQTYSSEDTRRASSLDWPSQDVLSETSCSQFLLQRTPTCLQFELHGHQAGYSTNTVMEISGPILYQAIWLRFPILPPSLQTESVSTVVHSYKQISSCASSLSVHAAVMQITSTCLAINPAFTLQSWLLNNLRIHQ